MSTRDLLDSLARLTYELDELITERPELLGVVRVGVDWAGYGAPYPHGEVQLDATTTPVGLLSWFYALGATSGHRLDGAPLLTAEGRIGGLPVGLVAPLPAGVEALGRRWAVQQLRDMLAAPSGGAR